MFHICLPILQLWGLRLHISKLDYLIHNLKYPSSSLVISSHIYKLFNITVGISNLYSDISNRPSELSKINLYNFLFSFWIIHPYARNHSTVSGINFLPTGIYKFNSGLSNLSLRNIHLSLCNRQLTNWNPQLTNCNPQITNCNPQLTNCNPLLQLKKSFQAL